MRLQTWLGLVTCNIIWALHPVFGKWLLEDFQPVQVAWLRYTGAFLAYLIFASFRKKPSFFIPKTYKDKTSVVLIGLLSFCLSPLLQMTGLAESLAAENAILVAIEPLLTVLFAWILLKEKPAKTHAISFILALIGFSMLSGLKGSGHFLGNLLILISMIGEASFSVLGRRLVTRHSPVAVFGSALLIGYGFLTASVLLLNPSLLVDLNHWHLKSLMALLFIGPVGTAAGYLYTLFAIAEIGVAGMAVFLFLQPVAGALFGTWFLNEKLTPMQDFGAVFILGALLISAISKKK